MSEFVGLAHFAEIPVVLIDVQRMGPSTGLPTRTSQGDFLSAATLSHGDTFHPMLIPATPEECFEFSAKAFDVAERLQTPVFVMLDLDLGMNYWTANKFDYPEWDMDRGKILSEADIERLQGDWGRYRDVDGDGVAYRTVPGNRHPQAAYFARGTGHDEDANYSEREDDWIRTWTASSGRWPGRASGCLNQSSRTALGQGWPWWLLAQVTRPCAKLAASCGWSMALRQPIVACGLAVQPRHGKVHRRARPCVRSRPEPRWSVAHAAAPTVPGDS